MHKSKNMIASNRLQQNKNITLNFKMTKNGQHDGITVTTHSTRLTSLFANNTFGTMCGRQRPSISMTLFSLSAIRDTWETKA